MLGDVVDVFLICFVRVVIFVLSSLSFLLFDCVLLLEMICVRLLICCLSVLVEVGVVIFFCIVLIFVCSWFRLDVVIVFFGWFSWVVRLFSCFLIWFRNFGFGVEFECMVVVFKIGIGWVVFFLMILIFCEIVFSLVFKVLNVLLLVVGSGFVCFM